MANPYDFNPFAPPIPKQPGINPNTGLPESPAQRAERERAEKGIPIPDGSGEAKRTIPASAYPAGPVVQQNPYARWATWQQPTDETSRMYYTNEQPRVAYQQFQNAWGQPNGNLQKFIDGQFGQVWANYIKQTELAKQGGGPGMLFPDTLTKQLGDQLQNQWQGQTAYQRGENYGVMNAGRRT